MIADEVHIQDTTLFFSYWKCIIFYNEDQYPKYRQIN